MTQRERFFVREQTGRKDHENSRIDAVEPQLQINEIDCVGKLFVFLVSFTTDAANRIVRNSGAGNGSEAWMSAQSMT